MKPIKNLKSLRKYVESLMLVGLERIAKKYAHPTASGRGWAESINWKAMRIVIVGSESGIRCCSRADKSGDETEIMMIRKNIEMASGRVGVKVWNKVLIKCAAWLEKRHLYPNRETITDITEPLF